jgi:hypothetical protein
MALPAYPNAISLNAVNVELGRAATTTISLNDAIVRTLFVISSGAIAMSNGHGKSNAPPVAPYLYGQPSSLEVGQTAHFQIWNPNNYAVAYTGYVYGREVACFWNCNYPLSYQNSISAGTLQPGYNDISTFTMLNGYMGCSYFAGWSNTVGFGGAGGYAIVLSFPNIGLNMSPTYGRIDVRGPNYQQTVWHDDECCRNGGCETGCNGSTTHEECNDNCCCYDCNGDGITACGNPADPDYDDSNPPCQRFCGDGVTDACGQSCNNVCDNGSLVNCPYSTEETTYNILKASYCN